MIATQPDIATPFAWSYAHPDGRTRRAGADLEALSYLASALNFNFSLVDFVDRQWGGLVDEETNAFNGMIGMVQRKEHN